jgi:hypothetical protein
MSRLPNPTGKVSVSSNLQREPPSLVQMWIGCTCGEQHYLRGQLLKSGDSAQNLKPVLSANACIAQTVCRSPIPAAWEAVAMGKPRIKPNYRRRVLRLPDLDHCKLAVLNSLGSPASRRVYEYAIDQFISWYCSEPRLAFNRIVVVRYRMHLESRGLAANTINQQLAAVRRLAHEAADSGLLSPELAAGISRVKLLVRQHIAAAAVHSL